MTPAEIAATKAAEQLDKAEEYVLDEGAVRDCVAIADGWIRLHLALTTGAIMHFSPD
ncbi:hypothetical protein AB0J43_05390 [Nonomuraea fuscirosea]